MSYSNYEQTVIINGHKLLGVQSVDGSYGINEKPIRVAGVGFIDAVPNAPLQGNFSINRKMVGKDPLIEINSLGKYIYDEAEIDGVIMYDNDTKGFGFTKGRISRYNVTCSVGNVPDIQTDITVYGDLGKNVSMNPVIQPIPAVEFPDQSSIKLNISDFSIDAVVDFSYSRSINIVPVYALSKGDSQTWTNNQVIEDPKLEPVQMDTQYPIETDITVTMIASEYEVREIKDRLQSAPRSDVSIQICDAENHANIINSFVGKNVRLISESVNSTIDGEMNISLSYKSYETYHNEI
jgi:hypothetical protein